MSAEAAVADLGTFAFTAIHRLQMEIRELREELEERDKELDEAAARIDRLRLELACR